MRNWDYEWNGIYYITICTGGRECFFGTWGNNEIILSESGCIGEQIWLEIPNHFHYVKLESYVIMPNHIHGILEICNRRIRD